MALFGNLFKKDPLKDLYHTIGKDITDKRKPVFHLEQLRQGLEKFSRDFPEIFEELSQELESSSGKGLA